MFFLHDIMYCCMNSYISYTILTDSLLYVNLYIQPNLSTAATADIDLAAAAVDDSLTTTFATHSASGVSISDDAEGNIKAVMGEEISDVVEASAPADALAAMAVTPAMLAAAVSSVVAVVAAKKGEVNGLIATIFSMNSYILRIHITNEFVFTDKLTFVSYEFLLYKNSHIQSNLATKEAAVSISDDLEGNMKAVLK